MREKVGAEQLQQAHHCTTQTGRSDCGPKVSGRAADGQQPESVTTGKPARNPWRIMTAGPAVDGH